VQIDEYKKAVEIFDDDYVYFSSYSQSWLEHSQRYVAMMCERFGFTSDSSVIEIASNDGYLLQYFVERGIPVLGIEPTANTAEVARRRGIDTLVEFWGKNLAQQLVAERFTASTSGADLILGNNVLAHVPDINDFVAGLKVALAPNGVITMEFPHLMRLVAENQFDTIYHEHFSYLSFTTVAQIFAAHGLRMFDVEELPTHGGSLRVFATHDSNSTYPVSPYVAELLKREHATGMATLEYYQGFQAKADTVKNELLKFLIECRQTNKRVVGYGAAAKGNTLLNYCGVKKDLLSFVVDASPHKQGKFLPGSHIPVLNPDALQEHKPEYVLILPWNLRDEVMQQHSYIARWGGKFVVAVPALAFY
jgi:2-polyprenyl-3-methyl-5-hydroxy-6-metoxy-1,4-benzoquinol methylase